MFLTSFFLKKDGPLGSQGESVSVFDLRARSKHLIQSLAWNSVSEGTQRIYKLNWNLFVEMLDWDFSFVCEFLLFRIQISGSLYSVLAARSALNFFWKFRFF